MEGGEREEERFKEREGGRVTNMEREGQEIDG